MEMKFKKLPIEKFGLLIQSLYNCEHNFTIEWMWDTGFDWSFSQCSYSGMDKAHPETLKLLEYLNKTENDWTRDVEYFGGVILFDYMQKYGEYAGRNTLGELNEIGLFINSL